MAACHRLKAALAQLPDRSRLIVWLRWVEQRPVHEIAGLLDLTPGAVAAAIYRARSTLRVVED